MDEFNNEEKNTNEFAGLSPAEQIAQLEKEIKGETVEAPAIEENEIKEEENTTVESCSTEKCKCKCGSCISICALILSLAAIVLLILMLTGVLGGKSFWILYPRFYRKDSLCD